MQHNLGGKKNYMTFTTTIKPQIKLLHCIYIKKSNAYHKKNTEQLQYFKINKSVFLHFQIKNNFTSQTQNKNLKLHIILPYLWLAIHTYEEGEKKVVKSFKPYHTQNRRTRDPRTK